MVPLTKTAALADYDPCDSVAVWQQCLAIDAYRRWAPPPILNEAFMDPVLCYNWGAAHFRAPGANPYYHSYVDFGAYTPGRLAAVYALSVLDRIDAPLRFLRTTYDRLQHGGLLVCTFAAWNADGEDCAVGHELRQRIYDRESWWKLLQAVKRLGFCPFGGIDLRYHGDTLGDHTLASVVAIKRGD